ncbi:winged helix DNA-binding protein [Paraclostridium bifermentans]|uniref:LexA family protein n=1 Tax=Paraclostridium bifermentans TaxID=1490 RepID=UPI00359C1B39
MYSDLYCKQVEILDFIRSSTLEKGYSPSIREIAKGVNLSSSSTVFCHLKKLEKLGYIKRKSKQPRSIVILDSVE